MNMLFIPCNTSTKNFQIFHAVIWNQHGNSSFVLAMINVVEILQEKVKVLKYFFCCPLHKAIRTNVV